MHGNASAAPLVADKFTMPEKVPPCAARRSRREVLRGAAGAVLAVTVPAVTSSQEVPAPLPGASLGRRPNDSAAAFLDQMGVSMEGAWTRATGLPFPETYSEVWRACRQFPELAKLRLCNIAPRPHSIEWKDGTFSFTFPKSGWVTPEEVDALIEAEGIRVLVRELRDGFAWRGRLWAVVLPAECPDPEGVKLDLLTLLVSDPEGDAFRARLARGKSNA